MNHLIIVEITIKLPDALARAFGATPEARSQRLTEDAAIEEYRSGHLSQRQVGEMLGLDYWQTEHFLSERNVSLNYALDEYLQPGRFYVFRLSSRQSPASARIPSRKNLKIM